MSGPRPKGPVTNTVLRGLSVLEALAAVDGEQGAGVTEIAGAVGLDKATAARLLNTLCATGYATQDPETRKYRLTAKILAIGAAYRRGLSLPNRSTKQLADLRRMTDETVHLGILEMDQVVYIAKLESQRPVQIASAIGQTMPLHTTALGKAILSALPSAGREPILSRLDLTPRTERSIGSLDELRADLEFTSERGYSIDDRENEDTIICVGAPIVDAAGQVHGAISVSGPSYRMADNVAVFGELCLKSANEIGVTL